MADEFDTALLIAEVQRKPLLYSKADPDYLNKVKKDQTWERIAVKFGSTGNILFSFWWRVCVFACMLCYMCLCVC